MDRKIAHKQKTHTLGVVSNDGLGNSLADGYKNTVNTTNSLQPLKLSEIIINYQQAHTIELGDCTSSLDANADVKVSKAGVSQQQDWLKDLVPQDFRLEDLDGGAIDLE